MLDREVEIRETVLAFLHLIKLYYAGGKVNRMALIVNDNDFKVALHGISSYCSPRTKMQVLFRRY